MNTVSEYLKANAELSDAQIRIMLGIIAGKLRGDAAAALAFAEARQKVVANYPLNNPPTG